MVSVTNNFGSLFVVSTPIGNLDDITLRAIKTLGMVDIIVCEDTRVSGKLLNHLAIKKTMFSYNNVNESHKTEGIIALLEKGNNIALISDAGTPLISDPGFLLVRACYQKSIKVVTIPGACSVISALSISSLPSNNFVFLGFLDKSNNKRQEVLNKYKDLEATLIFFESPSRILNTLNFLKDFFGEEQEIVLVRELTKLYEEVKIGSIGSIVNFYEKNPALGEMVVLIHPKKDVSITKQELESIIIEKSQEMKPSQLAKELAKQFNMDKNEVYKLIVEKKDLV